MSKWGDFDFREFEKLVKSFENAEGIIQEFIQDFLLEMAMRAVRKIKKRTPVGWETVDPGNLRRNWKVGQVIKQGDVFHVEIYNPVEYGLYVEFGHRTKGLSSWVEGRFMMTISMKEMERELPRYLERRVVKLMQDILKGRG